MTRLFCSTLRTIALLTLIVSLTGCQQASPTQDYLQRLSNALDVDVPDVKRAVFTFPQARAMQIEEVEQQISIREFLGLRECKLHLAIAERNSQMGKVASSSQRLKNDLDIINHGPACVAKIDNERLREKLIAYLDIKRANLPQRLWHAVLAESEYRKLWSMKDASAEYPSELSESAVSLTNDLNALGAFVDTVLAGKTEFSDEEFNAIERQLGRIRLADAGQLFEQMQRLLTDLQAANSMIEQRLERPLCLNKTPTPKAKIFENVVNNYFIQSVQAQAVKLMRRKDQIMEAVSRLETALSSHAKPQFNEWVAQRNSLLTQASMATKGHALLIQQLYQQCGLSAGNRTN